MNGSPVYTARCLCGAVTAEIMGDALWVSHCHCPSCQKATSAAFATYVGFDKAAVRFMGEEARLFKSSPGVERRFCHSCGSPVSFEGEAWPGEIHLHAGFINESDQLQPESHVYVRSRKPWAKTEDGLPTYRMFPRDDA